LRKELDVQNDMRAEPQRVQVSGSERLVDDVFKVDRVTLRYERFDGSMSRPITRLIFERGDAVAVLPYDRERRRVVLVRQFRYPACARDGSGWLWEIIAGIQDDEPESVAKREAREEAGLTLDRLIPVTCVYPSPGACTERVRIYLAPITIPEDLSGLGGLEEEAEDILVKGVDLDQALDMMRGGKIADAKTVIALQHLALHWRDLP